MARVQRDDSYLVDEGKNRREIHSKTVEDVLYLNSLLTFAVFIGLSQATLGTRSLENRDECNAGPGVSKKLIVFEVFAFACFLSSSLFAKALKLFISLDPERFSLNNIRGFGFKELLLILTAGSSITGIILLVASVVCLVQIQIGLFSCGSTDSRAAIWGVCTIVSFSLIIYVLSMILGIFASYTTDDDYYIGPQRGFRNADTV